MRISLGDVSLWFDVSGPSVVPQRSGAVLRPAGPRPQRSQQRRVPATATRWQRHARSGSRTSRRPRAATIEASAGRPVVLHGQRVPALGPGRVTRRRPCPCCLTGATTVSPAITG